MGENKVTLGFTTMMYCIILLIVLPQLAFVVEANGAPAWIVAAIWVTWWIPLVVLLINIAVLLLVLWLIPRL